jgi:cystathionine beta-lyase
MAEICLRKGLVICSDEIHCDLLFNGQRHTPIASLAPEVAQNTITLMAPSKTFNIAGLQCSFAIIQNKDLREKLRHATHGLVGWVNLLGMTAGLAAYRDGQEWLDQVLVYLQGNRDWLSGYIAQELPGVEMASPEGTYLAWLDCRKAGLPVSPYQFFLEQARVGLNDGATFGAGGEGFVRLNFGCSRSVLIQALKQMKASLEAIAQEM